MNDCVESVRLIQRYYNRTRIFRWTIQLHISLHFLPAGVVIQLVCQEDCTRRKDFGAKSNLTYQNGAPVADILKILN